MKSCPICKKNKSRSGKDFTAESLQNHVRNAHPRQYPDLYEDEYQDDILDLVDVIAGDESDGVYWGIAYELGYFG